MVTSNTRKSRKTPVSLLVFGCGYLGNWVAERAVSAGQDVFATTRRPERARQLADRGIRPLIADWNDSRTLGELPTVDRVLVAVSYDRRENRSRFESQVGGFSRLLSVLPPETSICYISTTGVYHQTDGRWVDENSPARPTRGGGQAHLAAEQCLHRHRPHQRPGPNPNASWTILRLAGIYGPGRVPRAADVIAGRPIRSPEDGFLNLIHVSDAADAVDATWTACGGLYVLADDRPVVRGDFYREIARQTGSPPPTFAAPEPGAPVQLRSASNKRVWNRKAKRHLIPKLHYPTYREGLRDVLESEG